jgi:predicted RNA-binding protein with PIN domain
MEIIIDGYNLIGSDQGLRGNLEAQRNWLVQRLSLYRRRKGFNVIVVFDGWRSGSINEVEEKRDEVTVVYSRQGERADSVIVRIARQKGSGCAVVTSDREIQRAVDRFGATPVYSGEFAAMMRNLDVSFKDDEADEVNDLPLKKGNPRQLSKSERKRRGKLKKLRP